MRPGDVIADRFEIEREAGVGGMGLVYRAIDRRSGGAVALKVMLAAGGPDDDRFAREAEVLAELAHPAIVRHVAHGRMQGGRRYLAMEWLDGEDLERKLATSGLTVAESVALARRVAGALGAMHERGIVHRDVKPSNLFIPGGDPARVTLVDFGVARWSRPSVTVTGTGAVIGTPAYMAPEQARGSRDVDARADVFALGCVLFECLTGRSPFAAEQVMAVLAKILLEDAPLVSDLGVAVPAALDELVARMLAKERIRRPPHGGAVAAELAGLGPLQGNARAPASVTQPRLTGGERRLFSVLFVGDAYRAREAAATAETLAAGEITAGFVELTGVAEAYGFKLEALADGSIVGWLSGSGAATDQAARAARCAIAIQARAPEVPIALATGRGVVGRRSPAGEVIARGAELLRASSLRARPRPAAEPAAPAAPSPIRVDDVTAGLLDARFDVRGDEGGLYLSGEHAVEATRTLLGRSTPCVGREREIGTLLGLFDECVVEPAARAVVVTAPPGIGKSRLRAELLQRLRDRQGAGGSPLELWMARGDPMRAGSTLGMIAQAVRSAAGVAEGQALPVRRSKLRARVGRHLGGKDLARVADFLGEIAGVPPDPVGPELEAARRDATTMGDQARLAWEDFLAAECAAQPVVLVLEDLHWGDLASIRLVDGALAHLSSSPLLVLALARPEVHEAFGDLWSERGTVEIRLDPLSKSGSKRLVRAALGEGATEERVGWIVDRAAGNAFYLEELVRAEAAGAGSELPETVLAMVQARLESLDPEVRRVLRAASVFGQVFWAGGVAALVAGATRAIELGPALDELRRREIVRPRGEGKFPGTPELAFEHALLRDAAYAMLTEEDRRLGHRLAAEWLEGAGETEAIVVAEHFERGGDPARAAGWYARAAEQALAGNDFAAAIERSRRGRTSGAEGEALATLYTVAIDAHTHRGEFAEVKTAGHAALDLLPRGSARWCAALARTASAYARGGDYVWVEDAARQVAELAASGAADAPSGPFVLASSLLAIMLLLEGRTALVPGLLDPLEPSLDAIVAGEPSAAGRLLHARAVRAAHRGDPTGALQTAELAYGCFERAGDKRGLASHRASVGYAWTEIGRYDEAEACLAPALAEGERVGLRHVVARAQNNLGFALARLGRLEEALRLESLAVEGFEAMQDRRMTSSSRQYLAQILLAAGAEEDAERHARAALELVRDRSALAPLGRATLARVLLARGRLDEALALSELALPGLASVISSPGRAAWIPLVHAEVLEARGDHEAARVAIAAAREGVLARAGQIARAEWRETFLTRVRENARILELAAAWGSSGG